MTTYCSNLSIFVLVDVRKEHGTRPEFERRGATGVATVGVRAAKICIFSNFAIFWLARSRLYQNEILKANMRLTAIF
jgi:hypothetical protein